MELSFPASNYLFKVNNRNTRKLYEICLKLTIKTPERCFSFFIVNVKHISHLFLMFTVDFEQFVACWNWTNNVQLQGKLPRLKWTPTWPKQGVRFRRCALWKGVHFREGFLEMRLKWRKTHNRNTVWEQKHSTYH